MCDRTTNDVLPQFITQVIQIAPCNPTIRLGQKLNAHDRTDSMGRNNLSIRKAIKTATGASVDMSVI